MKWLLGLTGILLIAVAGFILRQQYQESIDPTVIHGQWIETDVPRNRKETLTFSETSVHRNHHLVASKFEFDGSIVRFQTGKGEFRYRWNGSLEMPQLERIYPEKPIQNFVKRGFEEIEEEPQKITQHTNRFGL